MVIGMPCDFYIDSYEPLGLGSNLSVVTAFINVNFGVSPKSLSETF